VDCTGPPKLVRVADTTRAREAPPEAREISILPRPAQGPDPRPVTNLGKVFGQFADLHHRIAEQVIALEQSTIEQRQEIAKALAQLPELRDRINWLTVCFHEQSQKAEILTDRLNHQQSAIESLTRSIEALEQANARRYAAFREVVAGLKRTKAEGAK
jgi:uncharacterized coiled-coil DUF342 family protein